MNGGLGNPGWICRTSLLFAIGGMKSSLLKAAHVQYVSTEELDEFVFLERELCQEQHY